VSLFLEISAWVTYLLPWVTRQLAVLHPRSIASAAHLQAALLRGVESVEVVVSGHVFPLAAKGRASQPQPMSLAAGFDTR
jgi:hypothetical protein